MLLIVPVNFCLKPAWYPFRFRLYFSSYAIVLLRLDMPHTGVYIADLPGKSAAGVCRTKRVTEAGRYRNKLDPQIQIQNGSFPRHINSRQRHGQ